jgi:hypothetical protein
MTFGKRMELWRELAQRSHTTEPDRSVVADLIQQTETAHGMRDKIVHGIGWALSDRIDFHRHSNLDNKATKTRVIISADWKPRKRCSTKLRALVGLTRYLMSSLRSAPRLFFDGLWHGH